uniref:Candidate secreted effector n=1 Tax=Meloidogyne incognita TaxID=6306 RepID=A0A914KN47_MELIC
MALPLILPMISNFSRSSLSFFLLSLYTSFRISLYVRVTILFRIGTFTFHALNVFRSTSPFNHSIFPVRLLVFLIVTLVPIGKALLFCTDPWCTLFFFFLELLTTSSSLNLCRTGNPIMFLLPFTTCISTIKFLSSISRMHFHLPSISKSLSPKPFPL